MRDNDRPVLIMVTSRTRDEAERLGEELVTSHLAACGSVIPTIHSFYYWEGRLQREHEALLLIKTTAAAAPAVHAYVLEHHSNQLPEVIQLPIEGGSPAYLAWINEQVGSTDAH